MTTSSGSPLANMSKITNLRLSQTTYTRFVCFAYIYVEVPGFWYSCAENICIYLYCKC